MSAARRFSPLTAAVCTLALGHAGAYAEGDDTPVLRIAVGPAAYSLPRFPGSDRSRTIYFPFVDAECENRFYMSASDLLGFYAYKTEAVQSGVAIEWDPTRRQSQDDAHLRGLRDVKDTARVKFFASRTVYFVTLEENFATDLLGRGQGSISQSNLWFTAPLTANLAVNLGPGVSWADHAYMQSFYSVSAAAAARNALLLPYTAHAGFDDLHLNGMVEWQLQSHYRLGLLTSVAHLRGNAAGSPVSLQRAQQTLMGWVAYKFR